MLRVAKSGNSDGVFKTVEGTVDVWVMREQTTILVASIFWKTVAEFAFHTSPLVASGSEDGNSFQFMFRTTATDLSFHRTRRGD